MQFSGHSLPVHQSISVSCLLPCPISSAKSAYAISFDYWPLECVTSFRCITLEWHVWSGRNSKYNTCSIASFFSSLSKGPSTCLFFSFSLIFILWAAETTKSTIRQILFFFFCSLSVGLVFWQGFGDLHVSQNPWEFCTSHSFGQILVCVYTI